MIATPPDFATILSQLRDIARVYEDAPLALAALHLDDGADPVDAAERAGDVLIIILGRSVQETTRMVDCSREALPSRARALARLLTVAAAVAVLLEERAVAGAVNPETKGDLG